MIKILQQIVGHLKYNTDYTKEQAKEFLKLVKKQDPTMIWYYMRVKVKEIAEQNQKIVLFLWKENQENNNLPYLLCGVLLFTLSSCGYDKSNSIIFEKGTNEDYSYIIYESKEYVSYTAYNSKNITKYLGYIKDDEQDEIYTFKDYFEEKWLVNVLNTGTKKEYMLYEDKNITNILICSC